jgi:hypothetical protein
VEAYAANFDVQLTKHQGLWIEHGTAVHTLNGCGSSRRVRCRMNEDASEPCVAHANVTVRPLAHFATSVHFWGDRYAPSYERTVDPRTDIDVYRNGRRRRIYWYPAFGLLKLIVLGGAECAQVRESARVVGLRQAFLRTLDPARAMEALPFTAECRGACGHVAWEAGGA